MKMSPLCGLGFMLALLQLLHGSLSMKVSFFGDGYVSMPLQEAKMSTNIRVKFRTKQENAFLFLAAGRTDYCLLRLESGIIHFSYKIDQDTLTMLSPKKQKLNDLEWHDVAVQRFENNITLQVDGNIMRKTLAIEMAALNVHFGTFLGGVGDFPAEYLSDVIGFRGCISDVFYNNINIIKRAKERTSHTASTGVAWSCSNEFDGTLQDSISFLNNDSFALMLKESHAAGETLTLQFRTMAESGIIYFNGGYDFVLLEIENQHLKFTFNKAGSLVQFMTNESVSDGKWHRIHLRYDAAMAELMLDDAADPYHGTHANDTKAHINLEKSIFFGGVQEQMRRRLINKGLRINELSFKGCMRGLQVNSLPLGFGEMKISRHLALNCLWKYPCVEYSPCLKSGVCSQYGVDEFICYCDQSYCIKADFQGPFKIFTETSPEVELLYITPMQLIEGGTAFLSPHFIDILLDTRRYPSLNENSIAFHVVQQPKYGQLLQYSAEKTNFVPCRTFNLADLATDKLKYVHNGMENFNDHATLDMQIYGDAQVPENLLGKHRFLLHANITPVNDPPQLQLHSHKILRVIEGIERILDMDLFNIDDPDSAAEDLIYTILPSTKSQEAYGRFMVNGIPSMTFSQADVNVGKVAYLYNSTTAESFSYQLQLHVSDGIETSDTVYLPVSVHPLELRLVNNTGLIMIHKSSLLLTPANLSIGTNAVDEHIDIRYDVVKPPQYGALQRLRQIDGSWVNVDWFSDSQMLLGHIRYLHNSDFPWQDEFKFIASFGFVTTQTFDFRITFTRLRITTSKPALVAINGSREFLLTNVLLSYETVPIGSFPRSIIYKISKPTKYGGIYVEGSRKAAKEMDSFTQQDIDKRRIRYRTHNSCYSSFSDELEFTVSVAECDDVVGKLTILYSPLEELTNKLTYQKHEVLQVQEGERALLTKNHFEIRFNIYESLQFHVANAPEHGLVCMYEEQTGVATPIVQFTLEQLFRNDIFYCHDDTESTDDGFELLILSNPETDMQFVAKMQVHIKLVNDNEPFRTAERIFHVVRSGIRTLNPAVLQYLDADVNTNHTDIHYIHVSSTNGAFYKSGHFVDSFSQDDISNRRIMFQHKGPDAGTASFIVTDHQHEVNGLLEIRASDPFVSMLPTNASIVQEGKYVVLKNKDFILETNLDMKLDEIYYEVIKPPSYGILMYLGTQRGNAENNGTLSYKATNFTSLSNFTHLDIERERLVYWNTEIASMDKVRYRVHIKNITTEGEVIFRIYPSAYWEPLQVKKNQTLYVEESTSVLISRDILEVVHPNISPGDITFLVTSSPLHGYLEMQSMTFDDEYNCKVFDQSSVNTEKMFYIQAGVNQSMDYFIFDVTNGITWLRQLMLKIVIIPEKLYMHTNIISVVEGKTVQLSATDIQPYSEYYRSKILEYIVTITPHSGYIMAGTSKVKRFTQKQLEQGTIQYVHNGSENSTDTITMVALARNKESVPFELEFAVIPVNDEEPMMVTNTGLQVWNGGRYVIKYTDLMAQDYDTPAENLTYMVHHIYGGYLAQKSAPMQKIDHFTQSQINNEQIYFIHDANSRKNELSFVVTDGLFNTTTQLLNIEIKPIEIIQERNENLHVFPLTKKQILRDHLHFKCSDEEREIRYNITMPPTRGRIINEYLEHGGGHSKEVSEFTQNDVDNGHIFYEHTVLIMEFRSNDSFYFDVLAERSDRLLDQKFNIEISVSSGGLLRFLPVSKLNVTEGGSVPINLDFSKILEYLKTRAGIHNPELFIEAVQNPTYGRIGLGHEFKSLQRYHPSDFLTKKVYYIHDHTDTLEDTILMSVYLTQGNIFLCNLTIPVSIQPINDQPFQLITHLPKMTVVEGENRTITRNVLLTEDKDTPPEEIIYDVMSGPTLGVLKKLNNDGHAEELLAFSNQFTQADINNDRIVYVHFGMPQSTTFCFTVSDGQFNPAYEVFTIKVAPISLLPASEQQSVSVQQGATSAPMKVEHIGLSTNVQTERLSYNITNSPLYGIIVYKHQPTLRFTQQQLETSQISYMQTDLNRSNDTFQVSAYVPGTNYAAQVDVVIAVEPVIKINDVALRDAESSTSAAGGKVRLSTSLVNDNALSLKLNRFNPKFVITRMPATGQIRKIIRSTGLTNEPQNERSTNIFSYKELRSGVVYFVPNKAIDDTEADTDSFDYQLLIKTVQPAQATVNIEYRTHADEAETVHLGSTNISINYLAVGCALFIVIICILIVLLILKLRKLRKHKANISKDQPPALPCPPDLTSVSPQHNHHHHHNHHSNHYASSEADSVPATGNSTPLPGFSNIPHCKIIPVESYKHEFPDYDPDEDETDDQCDPQQIMLPHRYNPYQLEHDAWSSSCDMPNDFMGYASVPQSISGSVSSPPSAPPTNPLLRRNQYWV
ncbi:chondroitin sulfate proteoglycan 4 [Scaptodrosophila lebanonensis]|uniref:Chondroitin sulfate proteoglycan 4 n=1 Tax=Drosophila lebanonensis TaxID=7225 RepID=A0A6J2U7F0_DROLE|nr:chondroitin sulfate proteoglycan 4 [Scaptodrosophila lebanonensis]